jgi:hypothetical protein
LQIARRIATSAPGTLQKFVNQRKTLPALRFRGFLFLFSALKKAAPRRLAATNNHLDDLTC